MNIRHIATCALVGALSCTTASADENACATLAGTTNSTALQAFQVRDGESVDLISGAKTVHGKLLVFGENGVFRATGSPKTAPKKMCWRMPATMPCASYPLLPKAARPCTANRARRLAHCACCPAPSFEGRPKVKVTHQDLEVHCHRPFGRC